MTVLALNYVVQTQHFQCGIACLVNNVYNVSLGGGIDLESLETGIVGQTLSGDMNYLETRGTTFE